MKLVVSLFEDTDKTLWIGTDGGGINSYNPNVRKFTHHLGTCLIKLFPLLAILKQLLLFLFGKEFYLFNKKTSQVNLFLLLSTQQMPKNALLEVPCI